MLIKRTSMITGKERTLDIDVTEEQLADYYENSKLLQVAFPNLSPSDREFIKTGMTDVEWEETFRRDDHDNIS